MPRNSARTRRLPLESAFEEMHSSGFRSADLDAILAEGTSVRVFLDLLLNTYLQIAS